MTAALRIDRAWARVHRLAAGAEVTVRMLRPEDRDGFLAAFQRLSPRSRYLRFFTAMPRLPESVLHRLLDTDGIDHVALAAWRSVGGERIEGIGVARFIRLGAASDTAEAAIAVVDHMQRRGVGGVLLGDLCEAARERGIRRFRAEVMLGNREVAALLHDLAGDTTPITVDGDIAVYDVDVSSNAADGAARVVFRILRSIARGLRAIVGRSAVG